MAKKTTKKTPKKIAKKKATKRDTNVYELKDGKKRVYLGTSNNPQRRIKEHKQDGKKFTKLNILTPKMQKNNAEKKETNLIKKHKKTTGSLPKYNITETGQYKYGATKKTLKKIVKRIKTVNKSKKK